VFVVQSALTLRLHPLHPHLLTLRLDAVHPRRLGRGVETASGVASLAEVSLHTPVAARDAVAVVARAEREVSEARRHAAQLAEEVLRPHLARLRADMETLGTMHMGVHDPEGALAVARATRSRLPVQARDALAAQVLPLPGLALRLLGGGDHADAS